MFGLHRWEVTWRLILLTLPFSIGAITLLAGTRMGFACRWRCFWARRWRRPIRFFGIRGVGSIYYLAYGLNHMEVDGAERLWAIVGLVVLISILIHGLTVTPVMRLLDRTHGRDPDADAIPPPGLQGPGAG